MKLRRYFMAYKKRFLVFVAACLLLFVAGFGCGGGGAEPPTPVSADTLMTYHVKQLLFQGSTSEYGNAEIEIHVVNADTNESVLCAGVENGMQVVQVEGYNYDDLDVNFVRANNNSSDEITTFFFIVLERDSPQCPGPPDYSADVTLAKSFNLRSGDLKDGVILLNAEDGGTLTIEQRGEEPEPFDVSELENLRLKSVFIDDFDSGESSNPEIEVHLMDVINNSVVACMGGADRRMDAINEVSTLYDHLYVQPTLATDVSEGDTATWLRAVLIERDVGICPDPFVIGQDRVVGSSHVMSFDELAIDETITFPQNVAWMEIIAEDVVLESLGSVPVENFNGIVLDSLRYYGDIDEYSTPEIEIHLQDVWTEKTIACAGENHGLFGVNSEGTLYEGLNAALVNVWSSEEKDPVSYVRIIIADRDSGEQCPSNISSLTSDYLAEILVSFDELTSGPIEFDDGSLVEFK